MNYIKRVLIKNHISILIATIICLQNSIWPLWKGSLNVYLSYFCVFVLFFLKYFKIFKGKFDNRLLYALFIVLFAFVHFFLLSSTYNLSILFILLTYIICFSLQDKEKNKALSIVTKYIAIVVVISLPAWLLHLFFNVEIPVYNIIDLSDKKGANSYLLYNHILFLKYSGLEAFRFYSMFNEPGVLGTLSAFILFGNKYNFRKWENIVILLGGIFTYSMAFYILTIIGYFYFSIKSMKKFVISIVFISLLSISIYTWLKEDIAFQRFVIERFGDLDFMERVNNRTEYNAEFFYDNFINSSDVLMGVGREYLIINGLEDAASYKVFIIEYGLIGVLILLLMYLSMIKQITLTSFVFLFIFILSFFQRPLSFTSWQLLVFACILASLNNEKR